MSQCQRLLSHMGVGTHGLELVLLVICLMIWQYTSSLRTSCSAHSWGTSTAATSLPPPGQATPRTQHPSDGFTLRMVQTVSSSVSPRRGWSPMNFITAGDNKATR